MLNYEEFKKSVVEKMLDRMPEQYQDMKVVVRSIQKVNDNYDGLFLIDETKKNGISPSLNLTALYAAYVRSGDMEAMLDVIIENMKTAFQIMPFQDAEIIASAGCANLMERITFQLVNTENNKELLKRVPHRQFMDLSVIYRYIVATDGNSIPSAIITNELAKQEGIDEEELYRCAAENTRRILPPIVRTMQEVMLELMVKEGMPEEMADMMISQASADMKMFVVTNSHLTNGAASILYEYILHDLAARLDTDLYVLPSSLHEVIVVPADFGEPCELSEMVREINTTQVAPEDRLSDSVYYYDRTKRRLYVATSGNTDFKQE